MRPWHSWHADWVIDPAWSPGTSTACIGAGSPVHATFGSHGNLETMRCAAACSRQLVAVAEELHPWRRDARLDAGAAMRLCCPGCRQWMRPHVPWFDEFYDEESFHCDASRCWHWGRHPR